METLVYKRVGNLEIHADVRPAVGAEAGSPVLLLLHPGSLIAGGRSWFAQYQLDAYREAGYAVVAIDYRLAPETKGAEIFEDVRDAVSWIREELPDRFAVDGDRLAIVGHSAGGYLALCCGYRLELPPRALVAFYGYGDIIGAWYAKPDPHYGGLAEVSRVRAAAVVGREPIADGSLLPQRLDYYVRCRQQGTWLSAVFGHRAEAELAGLAPHCPDRNVHPAFPPTLLLHGDRDEDVPFEKAARMAEALAAHGVEHELLTVEGAGHTFDLPAPYRFGNPLFALGSRLTSVLAPLLPRTTFRGPAPARSERYMSHVLEFLRRQLA